MLFRAQASEEALRARDPNLGFGGLAGIPDIEASILKMLEVPEYTPNGPLLICL